MDALGGYHVTLARVDRAALYVDDVKALGAHHPGAAQGEADGFEELRSAYQEGNAMKHNVGVAPQEVRISLAGEDVDLVTDCEPSSELCDAPLDAACAVEMGVDEG